MRIRSAVKNCASTLLGRQERPTGEHMSKKRSRDGDNRFDQSEFWGGLLASAGPRDHIVQLYQDQQFLNRAVCRFAASAIANGEGVILVPTAAHWEAFRPRLESEGVDIESAQNSGQLTVVDA